jgi:hypothetical protein
MPQTAAPALSDILGRLLHAPDERIALGELVDAFGPRAFGALMFVFSIPNLLPLPPGSSTFLSIPLLIIAPQLMIGLPTLWLPRALDRRSLRRADLARGFDRLLPRVARIERLLAPRLEFLFGPLGDRIIGLVILALALVLVLPIPFGNLLPAAAIAALSLGLTQRDGVVVLAGYGIAGASVVVLILSAHAVVGAFNHLLRLTAAWQG